MVHFSTLALTTLLAATSLAAPTGTTGQPPNCQPRGPLRTITASYDRLPYNEDAPIPIGTLKGLKYDNFYLDRDDGFIKPSSGKQVAHSYDGSQRRLISVAKPGDAFDLKSLSLACVQGYPQNDCSVRIKGLAADGVTWMAKGVTFPKLNNTKPRFEMMKVEFDRNWKNLKSIEFEYAKIDGTGDYTGLEIDDLVYAKRDCN
ncbi:hypothetical protein W97_00463 [Coniosporium apollinis CBS 100218]|uniref:NADH:ubiquinone oxidoreductase intermediate-associated protein 30 domain-containing protein n=1 Tax=Coniosporium apollinis (strain CBS 100218) TaxID=1168221 RepID=R7YH65_CONA1|nr:uncharacterized protein W97_00463 [Coniosporium apollinis CBS 100218]EON61250.1 hypothetical protein W97_00463 [Coniosporium apollinis CBS 100218]